MISIITAAFNNTEDVERLLRSISQSTNVDFPFEAIMIDDGSRDLSIKDIVGKHDFARYIRLDKNSGASIARNTGARQAKYESLFFFV